MRQEKVAEQLKRELSLVIQNDLKDPHIGFITITRVDMSGDLRYAKVYFSSLGNDRQKTDSLNALKKAAGFIRKLIGEKIRLRYTPQLTFKLDESSEYSFRMAELLDKLKKG